MTRVKRITGEDLRLARESLGLSRSELARQLGVSENTVYRWETDRSSPLPVFVRDLTRILKLAIRASQ